MQQLDQDVLLGERYRLVRMLGSGGMGSVWEAEDQILGRPVAVKVLSESLAAGERAVRRFEREARAAARLFGPRIAAVYDFGRSEGRPYIVMELVRGETLADRVAREGPLPPQEAARIAVQVAQALEEAHAAGIVHRDVKPGNVMLTPSGEVANGSPRRTSSSAPPRTWRRNKRRARRPRRHRRVRARRRAVRDGGRPPTVRR